MSGRANPRCQVACPGSLAGIAHVNGLDASESRLYGRLGDIEDKLESRDVNDHELMDN